ncbi:hypothetical protein [Streptomyces coffeae]|uniref:Secreted protein n=1 Tax=Streptomyces coffeae TaxID=621382 RepID=A0ABS1N8U6_9ACTN|nr:hypothetical protein [Streptomyces coffeae]MBL1096382.1 hypothetical protein [Streptomyces coffeae]
MRHAASRTTGRRGKAIASSAVALCLGALLSGCGGGGDGYVAAGAAGPDGERTAKAVPPKGGVKLTPLDQDDERGGQDREGDGRDRDGRGEGTADRGGTPSATASGERAGGGSGDADGSDSASHGGGRGGSGSHDRPSSGEPGEGSGSGSGSGGGSTPPAPSTPNPPKPPEPPTTPSPPSGPAALEVVGDPERAAADQRWCEKVTVRFRNTGGAPVTSGTVTFATHIIDSIGIDWATRESKEKLPAPIGAGQKKEKTWTVCVDDWRVPLGMHIETRDVAVTWKPEP